MSEVEKICRGTYNAEIGQCQVGGGAVSDTTGSVQAGFEYDHLGEKKQIPVTIRGSIGGGTLSSFSYSGLIEGKTSPSHGLGEKTFGPLDLQLCWSDQKNRQSICSEFSSLPTPYRDNYSAGMTYHLAMKNFGAHTSAGWTSSRFDDQTLPSQIASAVFNGGVNVYGSPWKGFSLAGANYFLICDIEKEACQDGPLHQFGLQGLTSYPLSDTQRFFFSTDASWTHLNEAHSSSSSVRFQGSFSSEDTLLANDRFESGVRFRRQAPLFETELENRLQIFVREEVPLREHLNLGVETEGTPVLLREGTKKKGYDFQIIPFLDLDPILRIGGRYSHATPPTGGRLEEVGGFFESSSNFPVEGLFLFAGGSEFLWEDPLFNQPRTGFNVEGGGIYCLGNFCLGLTSQYNLRRQGDPFPSGNQNRWQVMTYLSYQDQPGKSSGLSPLAVRSLTSHGLNASSPYYPIPHYASPRLLYYSSPLSGGVWPFNIPMRRDGAETFNASEWYGKSHFQVAGRREIDPEGVAQWQKKGHANALKELLAKGIDGVCATCHVDRIGADLLKEWIDNGQVTKSFLDESDQIPNPWYSASEAKKVEEADGEYPYPETLMMAGAVRCQNAGCHQTNHTDYLKHILGFEGGKHHGVDALSQSFEDSLADKTSGKSFVCFGCHEGPGSDVNRDIHDFHSSQPLLSCEFCHTKRGPFNHASTSWGPAGLWKEKDSPTPIKGTKNGGNHGKTYRQEANTRGINNVSCRSCHDPAFCTVCHSRMNTHGETDAQRRTWGRGGRHSFSGVVLAQGATFSKANQERGNNCWVCHESEQNCFDSCHSGKRVTAHRFHPAGMINRHQAEWDALTLRCNSCHQEKKGVSAVAAVNNQVNCRECHTAVITDRPRRDPPHPVGWANRRLGGKTMHGEAVCDRGSPGICFQCHSFTKERNPDGPLSCFAASCHSGLKVDERNIPVCNGKI